MNPLQIQKDFYKEMDESIKEASKSKGEQGLQLLWNACKPKCGKTVQANDIEELYINNYSDEYKSGGVIGLVKGSYKFNTKITSLTGIIFQSKKICYCQ